jgi:hypothetical protein
MTKIILIIIPFFVSMTLFSQNKYTISGSIEDNSSGEKLISASVYDIASSKGSISNTYGFYSLTLSEGEVELFASYVGYKNEKEVLYLNKDTIINFRLEIENLLDEVTIVSQKTTKIEKKTQMSQIDVQVSQIEKIPSLLGEVDVLKTLQLLPGVQGGTEGLNGVYVRGGSPDQNLIVLDGVPVYNVSHLMGFLSVFNTDAIKNVTLTKGGFPARYGGRLSSVIEINMKEGNNQEFHGEGAIGILSSRLTLEGPLVEDQTSFMISGRRNYIDIIAKPFIKKAAKKDGNKYDFKAYFYDLNAKINHKLNDKHTIFASAYLGSDVFGASNTYNYNEGYDKTDGGIDWGNIIAALRWNYKINNKLFANTTFTHSRFKFDFNVGNEWSYIEHVTNEDGETVEKQKVEKFSSKYLSGIYDWAGKIDFDYIPNPNHYIRFGASNTYHTYNPGALSVKGGYNEDDEFNFNQKKMYSNEYYAYIEDDLSIGALKANLGFHLSGFLIGDKGYIYPQPRLGLRYLISDKWSLKASYATMAQYINLLTNESIGLPTDLWVPSTTKIKPQTSWQAAIGTATTFNDEIEFSIETYYKKMENVISYKEGASFYDINSIWEDKITQGNGTAYGAEFLLQKKRGKTTGWIGYTLAWNNRQFDEINSGKEYPYKFDRRHDIEIVVSQKITDNITLSGTWVYGTGNAITLAEASYIGDYETYEIDYDNDGTIDDTSTDYNNINILGEKNSYRMPAYHRLDLGVEFLKKTSWGERAWNFSVYNAYNRRNPFYVYLGREYHYNPHTGEDTVKKTYRQISLLPIIPSLSFRLKF